MSLRPPNHSAQRSVRALAREAAALPLPPLDWEKIESKLIAQIVADRQTSAPIESAAASPRVGRLQIGSPWTMALAAAAVVALVAGSSFTTHAPSRADVDRSPSGADADGVQGITLGDRLNPGDTVISTDHSLAYQKAGLVTFTLSPESSIAIVANERGGATPGPLTIALRRGSVHAEVTPQAQGEAFAIEVGQTRVAVHGTSFTVSCENDRARVEVMHGSVAVGPAGHPGTTQGWLLVGPERATFSLDGAKDAEWLDVPLSGEPAASHAKVNDGSPSFEPKPAKAAPLPAVSPSGHASRAAAERAESSRALEGARAIERPEVVDARSIAQRDKAIAGSILKELETCYQRQVSSFGVSFSIRSSLSLSILPSGAVREGVFDPPLSPTLMSCARQAITSARFPKGNSVRQFQVAVNLAREE